MTKKKWFTLSLVGAALLLIPRRSSRQTLPVAQDNLPPINENKSQPSTKECTAKDSQ